MSVDLGTVVAPGGALFIVDPGYLRMWSHDRPPALPQGVLSDPDARARAGSAVDLEIVGRDAEAVGRELDMQWHPRWVFDFPRDDIEALALRVAEIGSAQGLDARLVLPAARVTHRRRVDLAVAHGGGAGEVMFHGVWAAAITGVPSGPLAVVGEPMPVGGADAARLRRVVIVARHGPVARSERVGYVAVDTAQLLCVDLDALSAGSPGPERGCRFDTTWGDGTFEVFRDLDARGDLARIRVELGTGARVGLMRKLERRWSTTALVSRRIVDEGHPVRLMFREAAAHPDDSGWRLMAGLEDDAYLADPANLAAVRLSAFTQVDRPVDALLDEPAGSAFERRPGQRDFEPVKDGGPLPVG